MPLSALSIESDGLSLSEILSNHPNMENTSKNEILLYYRTNSSILP